MKNRNFTTTLKIAAFSMAMFAATNATAEVQQSGYFSSIEAVSELSNGDVVRMKNSHAEGATWLASNFTTTFPELHAKTAVPSRGYSKEFKVKDFGAGSLGFYFTTRNNDFFISGNNGAGMSLQPASADSVDNFKWTPFMSNGKTTLPLQNYAPSIPVSLFLWASSADSAAKLVPGQALSNGGGSWDIQKEQPCSVEFTVTSEWNNGTSGTWSTGYNARVTVTNTSDKDIADWGLKISTDRSIDQVSNGTLVSSYLNHGFMTFYEIKNNGSKKDLKAGESVDVYFSGMAHGGWDATLNAVQVFDYSQE